MASSKVPILIVLTTIFIASFSSKFALGNNNNIIIIPDSTISAAPSPALLPIYSPSPALSPDISPLFPSPGPGGSEISPSDSSLPIIPSSPSPPNPDAVAAFGPGMAVAPSGLLPDSSNVLSSMVVLHLVVVFGVVMQLLFG